MKYLVIKSTGSYCMKSFLIAYAGKTAEAPAIVEFLTSYFAHYHVTLEN